MSNVDTKNYEKYRTLCKIPVEFMEQYGKLNTPFQKMQCTFCSEEWYVAPGKENRVKVCPFCSLSIDWKQKMHEKTMNLPSEKPVKKDNKKETVKGRMPNIKVGNTIEFASGIKWKILEESDEGVLLICEDYDVLKPYHEGSIYAKWGSCTLRQWLNNEFLRINFRENEKKYILNTTLETKTDFMQYKIKSESTVDKVFIFNKDELKKYGRLLRADCRNCLLREASPKNGHRFVVTFRNVWVIDDWGVRIDYPSNIKPVMRLSWDYFLEQIK